MSLTEEEIRRDQIRRDCELARQTVVVPKGANDQARRVRIDVAMRIVRAIERQRADEDEVE